MADEARHSDSQGELVSKPLVGVDPHHFDPMGLDSQICSVCGMSERWCKLTYKPREVESYVDGDGNPRVRVQDPSPCEHFTGLRQWGINPEPWRRCTKCNWPKAAHDERPTGGTVSQEFERDLQALINRYSLESPSNTPDFVLAAYLVSCLKSFNMAQEQRERFYK